MKLGLGIVVLIGLVRLPIEIFLLQFGVYFKDLGLSRMGSTLAPLLVCPERECWD